MVGQSASTPQIKSPQEASTLIRTLPGYARFGYTGLGFLDAKLYASTNIGLLEFENGNLSRLYSWSNKDDVVSGPWMDRAHQSLWIFHDGLRRLMRFDGKSWRYAAWI
jgi:hypothetical protein